MTILYVLTAIIILLYLVKKYQNKGIESITTSELKSILAGDVRDYAFYDVRTPAEFKSNKIKGFSNIPLNTIPNTLAQFPKDKKIILICQSGSRSSIAAKQLKQAGLSQIINVRGGMNLWR